MKCTLLTLMIATLALGELALSSSAHSAGSRATKVEFNCSNGRSLTVVFNGATAIVTAQGSKAVTLTQALAADGFRYTRGKYSLRGRGDWVGWTAGRGKPLNCHARD